MQLKCMLDNYIPVLVLVRKTQMQDESNAYTNTDAEHIHSGHHDLKNKALLSPPPPPPPHTHSII